jgi:hypothetical protein
MDASSKLGAAIERLGAAAIASTKRSRSGSLRKMATSAEESTITG